MQEVERVLRHAVSLWEDLIEVDGKNQVDHGVYVEGQNAALGLPRQVLHVADAILPNAVISEVKHDVRIRKGRVD